MTGFASMEPVVHAYAKNFASAITKIQLGYGFSHTIILIKESKFNSVSFVNLDLLCIDCHILSGDNHNPMMVKRVNQYLTKGLKIMTNKRDSVCIAHGAIVLLLYAWKSCPILGTNISYSLVAVGCKFFFPSNYLMNKHWELTSSPNSMESYSQDLATFTALCVVTHILDQE
jgi:hypothetical protein